MLGDIKQTNELYRVLQVTRRINNSLQIVVAVLLMSVIGLENIASSDPKSNAQPASDTYYAAQSRMLLYALAGLVYLIFGMFFCLYSAVV